MARLSIFGNTALSVTGVRGVIGPWTLAKAFSGVAKVLPELGIQLLGTSHPSAQD
jgi:hypothetical protein